MALKPIVGSLPKGGNTAAKKVKPALGPRKQITSGSGDPAEAAALIGRVGQEFAYRRNPEKFVANQQKIIQGAATNRRAILDQYSIVGKKAPTEVLEQLDIIDELARQRATVESIHPSVLSGLMQRGDYNPVELFDQEEKANAKLLELSRDTRTSGARTEHNRNIALARNSVATADINEVKAMEAKVSAIDSRANRLFSNNYTGMGSQQLSQVLASGDYAQFGSAHQFSQYMRETAKAELTQQSALLTVANKRADLAGKRQTQADKQRARVLNAMRPADLEALQLDAEQNGFVEIAGTKLTLTEIVTQSNKLAGLGAKASDYRVAENARQLSETSLALAEADVSRFFNATLGQMPNAIQQDLAIDDAAKERRAAELRQSGASEDVIAQTLVNEFAASNLQLEKDMRSLETAYIAQQPKALKPVLANFKARGSLTTNEAQTYIAEVPVNPLATRNPIFRQPAAFLSNAIDSTELGGTKGYDAAGIDTYKDRVASLSDADKQTMSSVLLGGIEEHAYASALSIMADEIDAQDEQAFGKPTGMGKAIRQMAQPTNGRASDFLNGQLFRFDDNTENYFLDTDLMVDTLMAIEDEARKSGANITEGRLIGRLSIVLNPQLGKSRGFASQSAPSTLQDHAIEAMAFPDATNAFGSPEGTRMRKYMELSNGIRSYEDTITERRAARRGDGRQERRIRKDAASKHARAIRHAKQDIETYKSNSDNDTAMWQAQLDRVEGMSDDDYLSPRQVSRLPLTNEALIGALFEGEE